MRKWQAPAKRSVCPGVATGCISKLPRLLHTRRWVYDAIYGISASGNQPDCLLPTGEAHRGGPNRPIRENSGRNLGVCAALREHTESAFSVVPERGPG